MAGDNDSTLTAFLNHFNAHDLTNVMAQFCDDVPTATPPNFSAPGVGITDHGPAFWGKVEVKKLFNQLFTSFANMQWTQLAGSQRLNVAPRIGLQMMVSGQFVTKWFQTPSDGSIDHSSAPLTQLPDNPQGGYLGRYRSDANGLPAFSLFTFNASNLIQQLQIYTDRYALMMSITTTRWDPEKPPAPHGLP